ncbi:hypothetical protein PJE062_3094 [Pseudovibrio sp. JE062]|nr:hypothetical protein PJE062_3094 [Pseudovibrio sp. JE062]
MPYKSAGYYQTPSFMAGFVLFGSLLEQSAGLRMGGGAADQQGAHER